MVAGVAALMYQVNDKLTWRDVRRIMAETAQKIDDTKSESAKVVLKRERDEFIAQDAWVTNAAGYSFHNWYGFGMVDATKAVQMAANNYTNLPDLTETDWKKAEVPRARIPEHFSGVKRLINVDESMIVEAIEIKISITHSRPSDLAIVVTSPSRTRSVIFTPFSMIGFDPKIVEKFDETILLSHALYGESARGRWMIEVVDTSYDRQRWFYDLHWRDVPNNRYEGAVESVALKVYGHKGKR